jgi:hypothetical protein
MRPILAILLLASAAFAATEAAVPLGKSVTLTASATGSTPITYQWSKNGVAISGATASAYSIPVYAATHAGSYTVKVSNLAGSATSQPVALSTATAPVVVEIKVTVQ